MPTVELSYQQILEAVKHLTPQEQQQVAADLGANHPTMEFPAFTGGDPLWNVVGIGKGTGEPVARHHDEYLSRKTASMATPVLVDTGAHYALADAHDPDHRAAVRLLQQIVRLQYALVTTTFVIAEVYTLISRRLGWKGAIHHVDEDTRAEAIDGVMMVHSPACAEHDDLSGFITALMCVYAHAKAAGEVLCAVT